MTAYDPRPMLPWGVIKCLAALSAAFFYALFLAIAPGLVPRDNAPGQVWASTTAPLILLDPANPVAGPAPVDAVITPPAAAESAQPWPGAPTPILIAEDAPERAPAVGGCPAYQLPTSALWARWAPHGLVVSTLAPDLALAVTAEVNRLPPETDWTPLRVKIAEGPGASAVILEFANGCAWTSGPRPKPEIRALLSRAAGA